MLLPLLLVLSLLVNGFVAASEPHALVLQESTVGGPHHAESAGHGAAHGWSSNLGDYACHEPEATQDAPDCSGDSECTAVCATGAGFASLAAGDPRAAPAALSVSPALAWLPPDILPLLRPPRPTA